MPIVLIDMAMADPTPMRPLRSDLLCTTPAKRAAIHWSRPTFHADIHCMCCSSPCPMAPRAPHHKFDRHLARFTADAEARQNDERRASTEPACLVQLTPQTLAPRQGDALEMQLESECGTRARMHAHTSMHTNTCGDEHAEGETTQRTHARTSMKHASNTQNMTHTRTNRITHTDIHIVVHGTWLKAIAMRFRLAQGPC